MESNEPVACPVCTKPFSPSKIQAHVEKCLFLTQLPNESLKRTTTTTTTTANKSEHPNKKAKYNDSCGTDHQSFSQLQTQKEDAAISIMSGVPLAEQLRPMDFENYIGQEHVLGVKKVLRTLLEKNDIPSMILWGPPGCGKTTLAHVIATQCKNNKGATRFVKLSATTAGVNDVKEVANIAKNELNNFRRRTILFMDEIHRFNKLQQDIFLPLVEIGTITLIGATTENPSFSLNSALLSRCRVIVLEKLSSEDMMIILKRALKGLSFHVKDSEQSNSLSDEDGEIESKPRLTIDEKSVQWLADMSDGDARSALNSLEMALKAKNINMESTEGIYISVDDIKDGIKRSHLLYDRKGDEHYTIISALHKSIRASDDNAALYWVTRMLEGGEDPEFVGRRLVRAASEDIGLADPQALVLATAALQGCKFVGMPECDVLLAQCAVYLARAPKSQEVYRALRAAKETIKDCKGPQPGVPLHLRNATSRLARELGWGHGYNMKHKDVSGLKYLPEELNNVNFFSSRRDHK